MSTPWTGGLALCRYGQSAASTDQGNFQQITQIIENRLAVAAGRIAQHQIAVRIDQPKLRPRHGLGGLFIGLQIELIAAELWILALEGGVIVGWQRLGQSEAMTG